MNVCFEIVGTGSLGTAWLWPSFSIQELLYWPLLSPSNYGPNEGNLILVNSYFGICLHDFYFCNDKLKQSAVVRLTCNW